MKDNDHILTLQETEELCRLYMECQLSVLEERELQYILGKTPYNSAIIVEARESMIAEGMLSLKKGAGKKPKLKWLRLSAGIAASLAILFSLSLFIANHSADEGTDEIVIAYERGHRLSPEDSEKAVSESLKKAEELMAMAKAKEREEELKQEYFMQVISDKTEK